MKPHDLLGTPPRSRVWPARRGWNKLPAALADRDDPDPTAGMAEHSHPGGPETTGPRPRRSPGPAAPRLEPRRQSRWSHAAIEPVIHTRCLVEPWPDPRRPDRGPGQAARPGVGPRLPGN